MAKKIMLSIVLILALIASALFIYTRWERHFTGYLLWGFETAIFIPGEDLNYVHGNEENKMWIYSNDLSVDLYEKAPETVIYDSDGSTHIVNLLKVDFMGRLSLPLPGGGGYGHGRFYSNQVEITKVNSFERIESEVDIESSLGEETESDIPTNIDQAVSYFEQNWTDEEKESFSSMEEDEAVVTSHFSTGLWIRNNWLNKEKGEDLVKYFQKQGIENKDDMSGAILRALHKKLNS